ncbi:MAG: 30S ribosomal protein S12 methylthiotransferase RimO [Planctomycetia bacterium]|nr:30S ribosomal protein S12 methylthiotransferase RimO [Planctomycetia bacterium]
MPAPRDTSSVSGELGSIEGTHPPRPLIRGPRRSRPNLNSDRNLAATLATPRSTETAVGSPKDTKAGSVLAQHPTKGTYAFVSLGCPKNLVDSERMLGLLQLDGYRLVNDPDGADLVVVNTCGFIEQARQESYGAIREMLALKRRGGTKGVIVSGCLAEREKDALLERCPEIDYLVGVFGRESVTKVADRLLGGLSEQRTVFQPAPSTPLSDRSRLRITPRHFAFLKISEGCDRLCTFCAIPKMRGKHATKPIEEVLAEARELVADGVRELNIVAQDTTYYGMDLYGRPRLAELLTELDRIEGLDWIRVMYVYPMYVTDDLVGVLAGARRIVPYLDIPLQHINDTMLRRMQRRVTRRETEELLARLRGAIPNLVLRTTFITGFPGETDEQFAELVAFVRRERFERMGVFTYSFEPDTPAARLTDHVEEAVKEARRDELMRVQQEIAFGFNESRMGRRLDVLLDAPVPDEKGAWIGRTYADAPDVDAVVYVTGRGLRAGSLVECEVVATHGYDLVAAAVGKPR